MAATQLRILQTGLALMVLMAWNAIGQGGEILDFRLPEYDNHGNKVSLLTGDRAKPLSGGEFEITNLKMELYKNGKTDVVITTPLCRYNQETGRARSKSDVKMEKENMVLTGRGFAYDRAQEHFVIESNVKVVIKNIRDHDTVLGEEP
jgi:hypothetical protein